MKKSFKTVLVAGLCAAMMSVGLLGGCAGANSALDDETAKNRQFMASVNQVMVDIQSSLDGFNDAVGAGDVVAMKTQLDNTADCLEALRKIEAPAGLSEIKQDYVDGTTALQGALGDYITLYSEIAAATADAPFDWTAYGDRVAAITASYQDGIAKLQAGDEAAASKE